jgi:hypothetical protein
MTRQTASTTAGKLQYHREETPVPPWEYWNIYMKQALLAKVEEKKKNRHE